MKPETNRLYRKNRKRELFWRWRNETLLISNFELRRSKRTKFNRSAYCAFHIGKAASGRCERVTADFQGVFTKFFRNRCSCGWCYLQAFVVAISNLSRQRPNRHLSSVARPSVIPQRLGRRFGRLSMIAQRSNCQSSFLANRSFYIIRNGKYREKRNKLKDTEKGDMTKFSEWSDTSAPWWNRNEGHSKKYRRPISTFYKKDYE